MLKNKKGFTLIELLVVIAIIGLLSTLAVVALSSARIKARDSKRVADMKQLQTAMEMVYSEKGSYAGVVTCTATAPNDFASKCTGDIVTYLGNIAKLKDPLGTTACAHTGGAGVECNPTATCDYSVAVAPAANAYKFCFYLEGKTGDLDAGAHEVSQNGIK